MYNPPLKCNQCSLGASAFNTVNSVGHDECDLYVLADYPRQEDDASGRPLTNPQNHFLFRLLNDVGVKYRVGYCVRCIPVDPVRRSYRKPTYQEMTTCSYDHLFQELETLKPKAILLLGQIPVDLLYGEGTKISTAREKTGELVLHSGHKIKVITTYHPSYVLSRGDDMFVNRFAEDMVYACRHAMAHLSEGKYVTKTVNADMFVKICDMWYNNPDIEYIVYDTETNGLNPLKKGAKITSLSLSVDGLVGINVFLYNPEDESITDQDRENIRLACKKLLTSKKVIAHNAKHEHRFTKVCFKFVPNITDDTMLMAYILFMSMPGLMYNLKFLSGRFLAMPPWEEPIERFTSLFKELKRVKTVDADRVKAYQEKYPELELTTEEIHRFFKIIHDKSYFIHSDDYDNDIFLWLIPNRVLNVYGGMDAVAPFWLHKIFRQMIDSDAELSRAYRLLVKGADTFSNIELKGCRIVDMDKWATRYRQEIDLCLKELLKYPEVQRFEKDNEVEYNPNSADHNAKVFFTYMGFPIITTTAKGAPSTAETVIIELVKRAEDSNDVRRKEFLMSFRRWKKLKKILSSYFEGLSKFINPNDAFDGHSCETLPVPPGQKEYHIHPQYKLHGTETGRLSSQGPSMHTIPWHSDVKKVFVPHNYKRGGLYLGADQSQLELRVLASVVEKYYGDSTLADAYRQGKDIHRFVASKVFQKDEDQILDDERRFSKTISFSIVYGASEASVSESTGRMLDEVKQLFSMFFQMFPGVRAYIDDMHRYARTHGCVRTPMGRIRHLPGALDPNNRGEYSASMRRAQNTPIQSSGSDISLLSIVYMDNFFKAQEMMSRVIAFVHDSITLDVHPGEFEKCMDLLYYAMKELPEQMEWVVAPLGIDLELSDNLGEAAEIKSHQKYEDGSLELVLSGHKHVIDNVVGEFRFAYTIMVDDVLEEKEVVEQEGSMIARKVINLSFSGQKFIQQKRRIRILAA